MPPQWHQTFYLRELPCRIHFYMYLATYSSDAWTMSEGTADLTQYDRMPKGSMPPGEANQDSSRADSGRGKHGGNGFGKQKRSVESSLLPPPPPPLLHHAVGGGGGGGGSGGRSADETCVIGIRPLFTPVDELLRGHAYCMACLVSELDTPSPATVSTVTALPWLSATSTSATNWDLGSTDNVLAQNQQVRLPAAGALILSRSLTSPTVYLMPRRSANCVVVQSTCYVP
jgi:hypothetical protein